MISVQADATENNSTTTAENKSPLKWHEKYGTGAVFAQIPKAVWLKSDALCIAVYAVLRWCQHKGPHAEVTDAEIRYRLGNRVSLDSIQRAKATLWADGHIHVIRAGRKGITSRIVVHRYDGEHYVNVGWWALNRIKLDRRSHDLWVYCLLRYEFSTAGQFNGKHQQRFSETTIADVVEVDVRTLRRVLDRLEQAHVIRVYRSPGQINRYEVRGTQGAETKIADELEMARWAPYRDAVKAWQKAGEPPDGEAALTALRTALMAEEGTSI